VKTLAKNPSLSPICLKVIGNLLTGDNSDIDEMINYGVIELLDNFIDSSVLIQQKESIWALSNIAAGSKKNVDNLISTKTFKKIIEKIKNLSKQSLEILLECVWTVSNAISGCDIELSIKLIDLEILQVLIHIFDKIDNEVILIVALNGLSSLFRLGEPMKQLNFGEGNVKNPIVEKFCYFGGHFQLEKLQNHKNSEVYNKTEEIVRQFFNFEDYDTVDIDYTNNDNIQEKGK